MERALAEKIKRRREIPPDEGEVILSSRNGHPDRFRVLVNRYRRQVLSICYRMVGRWHEAEELAQQTFVDAFCKLETFDVGRPFQPWLCRIAVNNCKDYFKSKKRSEIPTDFDFSSQSGFQATGWDDPERRQLSRERVELLHKALLTLPIKYREVLILKDIEELAYKEIHAMLGLPITTLKIRVIRARRKLARALDKLVEDNEDRSLR